MDLGEGSDPLLWILEYVTDSKILALTYFNNLGAGEVLELLFRDTSIFSHKILLFSIIECVSDILYGYVSLSEWLGKSRAVYQLKNDKGMSGHEF